MEASVRATPPPSSEAVSRRMARVRTAGTAPEQRLRTLLHSRGLRYRVNRQPSAAIRCRPDLVFGPARVAVFIDGCFWHGCPQHASWPKSNAEWWRQKIAKNQRRDAETSRRLTEEGWLVLRIWEHMDPTEAAKTIQLAVRERRSRRGRPSP